MGDEKLDTKDVTPKELYANRRLFLKSSIYALSSLGTYSLYRSFRQGAAPSSALGISSSKSLGSESLTKFQDITNYNNFYEFSTSKENVIHEAKDWSIQDWKLEIGGLVESAYSLTLKDLREIKREEKIYRFRCVEGWSMVIPWNGFSLSELISKARPSENAKYVSFETYYDPKDMPNALSSGISFPYIEGLRLDEALHPLTILATGIYGKNLENQNGAPIRLVVPWKYGFKSIKSITKITLTDEEPRSTWNLANPSEYGFYSNVNPDVDHPRWSQKNERRIGEAGLRPTLPFNGYASEVAHLYQGMDLRKNF